MTYMAGSIPPSRYPYPLIDLSAINEAWDLFKERASVWIVAILSVGLVNVAIGIGLAMATGFWSLFMSGYRAGLGGHFTPPASPAANMGSLVYDVAMPIIQATLFGGLYRMAYRQTRGEMVQSFDFLNIGDIFLPLLGYGVLYGIVVAICAAMCYLPLLFVQPLFLVAPVVIAAEGANPIEAISRSASMITSQYGGAVLVVLMVGLIFLAGFCTCGLGLFVAYPLSALVSAVCYMRLVSANPGGGSGYGPGAPSAWPPPPGAQPPYGAPSAGPPPYGSAPQPPYGASPTFGQPSYGQYPYGQAPGAPAPAPPPYGSPSPPSGPYQPPSGGASEPREPRPPLDPGQGSQG